MSYLEEYRMVAIILKAFRTYVSLGLSWSTGKSASATVNTLTRLVCNVMTKIAATGCQSVWLLMPS